MKGDLMLGGLTIFLFVANVWVVFLQKRNSSFSNPNGLCTKPKSRDKHVDVIQAEQNDVDSTSGTQCPAKPSSLPAKCLSLLHAVPMEKGLVLGKPKIDKVFLTIGVPTWDDHADSLRSTLTSLFSHVPSEDRKDVLVVVSVSQKCHQSVVELMNSEFSSHMEDGLLQVILPTEDFLRVLESTASLGLRNFGNFSKAFISEVEEFNKHFIFSLEYCRRLSEFHLQLSDQVETLGRFLPTIKKEVEKADRDSYYALQFSEERFISSGRLFPSDIIRGIAEFGVLFGPLILPVNIMEGYRSIKRSRGELILTKEWLFRITAKRTCDRPPAKLETTLIPADDDQVLDITYNGEPGFYWATDPKSGQHLKVTFLHEVYLTRILIETGSPFFSDYLDGAHVRVCPKSKVSSDCSEDNCSLLSVFGNPVQDLKDLDNTVKFPVKCIRLEFKKDSTVWLIVRDIAVWVDKKKTTS